MQLQYGLQNEIAINGKIYPLDLSFNTILKIMEVNNDNDLMLDDQMGIIFKLLFNFNDEQLFNFSQEVLEIEELLTVYNSITKDLFDVAEEDEYDEEGLLIKLGNKNDKQLYDIEHDAKLIYAGFWQAYGIDLYEQHGKLHWIKFKALLAGLPKDTRFAEVTSLRAWEPSKVDYDTAMRRNQQKVALPYEYEDYDEDDV